MTCWSPCMIASRSGDKIALEYLLIGYSFDPSVSKVSLPVWHMSG